MSDAFWIALFATVPSLATLAGIIYSVRVSQGNRQAVNKVADTVEVVRAQTDGLMAKMTAAAEAKGIETGHAAGVASGVAAGVKLEQDSQTK